MAINHSSSMFIGETSRGVSLPVFWDTHTPLYNNKPPSTLVTGAPGSGKTNFALTVTAISALLGKTTVVIDPKGDFVSLYNLKDELGDITFWNLGQDGGAARGRAGVLDPFYMSDDPGETLSMVMSVIDLFVGGLTPGARTAIAPIIQDVIQMPVPSLKKVVEMARSSDRRDAQDLGTSLNIISKMPISKLCFSPGNRSRSKASLEKGLTVITLGGITLPSPEESKTTDQGRLISGVLYLLTDFVRRMMHNDESMMPKLIVIDECWAVTSSQAGAEVVKNVALLGRSKNTALMLITQNVSHLSNLDIENTITTRFAFQTDQREASSIIHAMNLPEGEDFERVLTGLNVGECLMQDFLKRSSTVQISVWRKDWLDAFQTNPFEKAKKEKERLLRQRQQMAAQQAQQNKPI